MLSIEKCREILNDYSSTDQEIENVRRELYMLAYSLLDIEKKKLVKMNQARKS